MYKFGEFLPGNSRDDRAHLRTCVPVLGENRLHTFVRRAAIQKRHGLLERRWAH